MYNLINKNLLLTHKELWGDTIKNIIIYGIISEETDKNLEAMRTYINKKKWVLVEAIFDYIGSCDGLFNLSEKLQDIDLILIYDWNNITDEFSSKFLYQIAHTEKIKIKEFISLE
ncbi:hypothetical protein ACNQFZ_11355 [Schinkia sp. CFF1]